MGADAGLARCGLAPGEERVRKGGEEGGITVFVGLYAYPPHVLSISFSWQVGHYLITIMVRTDVDQEGWQGEFAAFSRQSDARD